MNIIDVARSYVGIVEGTAAHTALINEFNTLLSKTVGYTMQYTDPWCCAFVSLCAKKAGADMPLGVGVRPMVEEAKRRGTWTLNPSAGAYIVYDWDADGLGDHIGIVAEVTTHEVITIEGNYSDMVMKRHISYSYPAVLGYIVAGNANEEPAKDPDVETIEWIVPAYGEISERVRALQALLIMRGYSCGRYGTDGELGPDTQAAISRANADRHVESTKASGTLLTYLLRRGE